MKIKTVASKILFSQMALLAIALSASSAAIYFFTSSFLTQNAQKTNADTARLAENIISRDMAQAALFSKLIAENYQLKLSLSGARNGSRPDPKWLSGQLQAELKSVSADFLSVAGADGVVFAHESRSKVKHMDYRILTSEPLFLSRVFQKCEQTGKFAVGVEPVYPNTLAVVAIAPVGDAPYGVVGYVRLGYRLDQRFVEQLRNVTRAHVAIRRRNEITAATLSPERNINGDNIPMTAESISRDHLLRIATIKGSGPGGAQLITAYPKSEIRSVRRRTTAVIAVVALAAYLLSAPLSNRLAKIIVKPLNALLAGVRQVEDGDLDTKIQPRGSDEVYALAESFNRMTGALRIRDDQIRKNQDQLMESGKLAAIGELAAGVAHEIGNPLAAISGYIQLLKGQPSPVKTGHYLDEMQKEIGFIDATIKELLDFSRPSRSEEAVVPLNGVVDECLRMLQFHKSSRGILIEKRLCPDNPRVLGSRKELLQAVLNIALNGLQAMEGSGSLSITVAIEESGVMHGVASIAIKDSGHGIDPSLSHKIFDPFFTTKRSGTGLGLSITYRIVQRHQGELVIDSKPGSGSTFTMLLPLYKED